MLLAQTQCVRRRYQIDAGGERGRPHAPAGQGRAHSSALGAEARVQAARAAAEMHGVKALHTVTELSIQLIRALYLRHDYSQRTTALYKHYYTVTIQLCIAIQLYTRYKSTPLCLTPAHAPAPTRRWEYDREGEGIKRAPDRTGRRWV